MTALLENVLIVNKHYDPIEISNARHALMLLYKGIAEAIDVEENKFYNYDFKSWSELSEFRAEFEISNYKWVHCVKNAITVPTIIRLINYDKYRKLDVKLTRRSLFARDGNICQYCGKKFKTSELSIDHVIPKSRGGDMSWNNVVCSCVKCNSRKGSKTLEESGIKLIRKPKIPKSKLCMASVKRHWTWKQFVDEIYWNVELE